MDILYVSYSLLQKQFSSSKLSSLNMIYLQVIDWRFSWRPAGITTPIPARQVFSGRFIYYLEPATWYIPWAGMDSNHRSLDQGPRIYSPVQLPLCHRPGKVIGWPTGFEPVLTGSTLQCLNLFGYGQHDIGRTGWRWTTDQDLIRAPL